MQSYDIEHITSSPRYPQSNGQAERMVQTVKWLLKKKDPYWALLSYRSTPLPWCNLSPSELLMGRRLWTSRPPDHQAVDSVIISVRVKQADRQYKERTKEDFDRRHRVQDLPDLSDDQNVWVSSSEGPIPGTVISPAANPRSYIVETDSGEIQRNRSQLRVRPNQDQQTEQPEKPRKDTIRTSSIKTQSQTGVSLKAPNRLY